MKTILFDIDGVLADFVEGFTKIEREITGLGTVVRTVNCESWDSLKSPEVWKRIAEERGFWGRLTPLVGPSVFQQINDLCMDNHVVFATSRFVGTPGPQYQTSAWLQRVGISRPNVVLSRSKSVIAVGVKADFSIEDKLDNAIAIEGESGTISYLLDRPYNRGFDPIGVRRVSTVSEFLREVEGEV